MRYNAWDQLVEVAEADADDSARAARRALPRLAFISSLSDSSQPSKMLTFRERHALTTVIAVVSHTALERAEWVVWRLLRVENVAS